MEKHKLALDTLRGMLSTEQSNRTFCVSEIEVAQCWIDWYVGQKGRGYEPDKRHMDRLDRLDRLREFLAETEERIANLEESIATLEVDL